MKVLLDTNAYAELKRGHDAIAGIVRRSERILFSAIVAGELFYGFRKGKRFQQNLKELEAFLDNPYVSFVPVGFDTADRFGRIASALQRKGAPIPTNDIWIAAHAMETGAELLSLDRHFGQIEGLAWILPSS